MTGSRLAHGECLNCGEPIGMPLYCEDGCKPKGDLVRSSNFLIFVILGAIAGVVLALTTGCVTSPEPPQLCEVRGEARMAELKGLGLVPMDMKSFPDGHIMFFGDGLTVLHIEYVVYEGGPDMSKETSPFGGKIEFVFACIDNGKTSRVYEEKTQQLQQGDLTRTKLN